MNLVNVLSLIFQPHLFMATHYVFKHIGERYPSYQLKIIFSIAFSISWQFNNHSTLLNDSLLLCLSIFWLIMSYVPFFTVVVESKDGTISVASAFAGHHQGKNSPIYLQTFKHCTADCSYIFPVFTFFILCFLYLAANFRFCKSCSCSRQGP